MCAVPASGAERSADAECGAGLVTPAAGVKVVLRRVRGGRRHLAGGRRPTAGRDRRRRRLRDAAGLLHARPTATEVSSC